MIKRLMLLLVVLVSISFGQNFYKYGPFTLGATISETKALGYELVDIEGTRENLYADYKVVINDQVPPWGRSTWELYFRHKMSGLERVSDYVMLYKITRVWPDATRDEVEGALQRFIIVDMYSKEPLDNLSKPGYIHLRWAGTPGSDVRYHTYDIKHKMFDINDFRITLSK
jgi:hypothetical protein